MPNITLSEAIAALKDANSDPATIVREIEILEAENRRDKDELTARIKSRTGLIRVLRKLAGKSDAKPTTAGVGGPSPTIAKAIGYIEKHGPSSAKDIARGVNIALGPLAAAMGRGVPLQFKQLADGRYALAGKA